MPLTNWTADVQAQEQQFRQRETALTSAEHKVELLRTRLENDVSTTQKAAQAVEAERAELKARAEELTEHEEQLEAWKQKFKSEALRQIGERERMLNNWQSKLEKKKAELDELQRSMEVSGAAHRGFALIAQKL